MTAPDWLALSRRALACEALEKRPGMDWIFTQERPGGHTMTHRAGTFGKTYSDRWFKPVAGGWTLVGPNLEDPATMGCILATLEDLEPIRVEFVLETAFRFGLTDISAAASAVALLEQHALEAAP